MCADFLLWVVHGLDVYLNHFVSCDMNISNVYLRSVNVSSLINNIYISISYEIHSLHIHAIHLSNIIITTSSLNNTKL
jgi:hypothetical protein